MKQHLRHAAIFLATLFSPGLHAQQASLVKNIYPLQGSSISSSLFPYNSLAVGNLLLFTADNSTNGNELWKTDGTDQGTVMLKDIVPGDRSASSSPMTFFSHNNNAYFTATISSKKTTWRSDGSEKGTYQIWDEGFSQLFGDIPVIQTDTSLYLARDGALIRKNINGPGFKTVLDNTLSPDMKSGIYSINQVIRFEKQWMFATNSGAVEGSPYGLFISDETKQGTKKIAQISTYSIVKVPSKPLAFFWHDDGTTGKELWKTDGTAQGTSIVKNIAPGGTSAYFIDNSIFAVANGVVFWASDGVTGYELWFSDGTETGTRLMKDFTPGSGGTYIRFLTYPNDPKVYLELKESELWCTDGTDAGTYMLTKTKTGLAGTVYIQRAGNNFYFLEPATVAVGGGYGTQKYTFNVMRADGKPNSSVNLGSINSSEAGIGFKIAGNNLYYVGYDDANGYELWKFPLCDHIAKINTPSGTSFCPGSSVTISAEGSGSSSAYTYQWKQGTNNVGTNASLTVTKGGIYTVEVTSNGCTVSTSVEMTESTNLPVTITGSPAICSGQSTVLTAAASGGTTPYTYQWKINNANTGTNATTLTASTAGSYNVTATDSKGCAGTSANFSVSTKQAPAINITLSGAVEFLPGKSVVISVPFASTQTYQWFKDGTTISGATNNSYTAKDQGSYTVTVVRDGCSATSQPTVVSVILGAEDPLSINDQMTISPNPASSETKVTISVARAAKGSLHLYDLSGKEMKRQALPAVSREHEVTLDMAALPAGTYIIKARISGREINRKIVKY